MNILSYWRIIKESFQGGGTLILRTESVLNLSQINMVAENTIPSIKLLLILRGSEGHSTLRCRKGLGVNYPLSESSFCALTRKSCLESINVFSFYQGIQKYMSVESLYQENHRNDIMYLQVVY